MEYKQEGAQFHNETSAQMCVSAGHRGGRRGGALGLGLGGFSVGRMESEHTKKK